MSDVRIRTHARCIENYCNTRLTEHDDTRDVRQLLRDVLGHTKIIIDADAEPARSDTGSPEPQQCGGGERWFVVYPGSERLDIGDKHPIAHFKYRIHAEEYVSQRWPGIGYVEVSRGGAAR